MNGVEYSTRATRPAHSLGLALPAGPTPGSRFLILGLADRFTSTVDLAFAIRLHLVDAGTDHHPAAPADRAGRDKIPGLDHISDLAHTFIRPIAGAILAAAIADASGDVDAWVGGLI